MLTICIQSSKNNIMVLFASPPQKHHNFPISAQALQFHYSFLRPCLGATRRRGLRMPPGEKSEACARAVLLWRDKTTRWPVRSWSDSLQFWPAALGCSLRKSFYHPTSATLHLHPSSSTSTGPHLPSFGFIPSVHLGDMLGRTPPQLLPHQLLGD